MEYTIDAMQSFLRKVVAGPRNSHAEAGLDLCYVTDNSAPSPAPSLRSAGTTYSLPVVVTSGPSIAYPSRAYRNPLPALVSFLESKHAANWGIWEFRAEGTGYPDSAVSGRIWHWPWPDHHPPPFRLLPGIVSSMQEWLYPGCDASKPLPHAVAAVNSSNPTSTIHTATNTTTPTSPTAQLQPQPPRPPHPPTDRVVVVHCKAGKGRSGTATVTYLMAAEGWPRDEAMSRFTARRMRAGFGAGVSIPSQVRYVGYAERWARADRRYVDSRAQVLEVHVWGLREGVRLAIDGFADEGKRIETVHVFAAEERDDAGAGAGLLKKWTGRIKSRATEAVGGSDDVAAVQGGRNVVYRPRGEVVVQTADVNLSVEKRAAGGYGWTMVTAVAHVWWNCFFEGAGPERWADGRREVETSGVFEIEWDDMDGIKGSRRKGAKAFDRAAVVWKTLPEEGMQSVPTGESKGTGPAQWGLEERDGEEKRATASEVGLQREGEDDDEGDGQGVSDDESEKGVQRGVVLPEDNKTG